MTDPTTQNEQDDPYAVVVPDTKDWTWVLGEPCPECGLVATDHDLPDVARAVRASVPAWREALARADARTRPAPQTWSVLEYAAHVRDVHRLFAERLTAMLAHDGARFANWDQDATAAQERYDLQDPAVVADELAAAAEHMAGVLESVPADAVGHRGVRSNGSEFTVVSLARYYLHDVEHHRFDVSR